MSKNKTVLPPDCLNPNSASNRYLTVIENEKALLDLFL
jgi:hypothetical protein